MTDDDIGELVDQVKAQRRYAWELLAHPDPRDPDYPGDDE